MKRNHVSKVDMARQLQISPSSVQGMLGRPTLQVQKLAELSEIFKYNFFREIADMLPYAEPASATVTNDAKEKDELQERIKALEMEVGILRQTLKDVVSR
ncbi:MAG TPA: hypothetical protein VIH57_02035 [Bacteroidales bacterium]